MDARDARFPAKGTSALRTLLVCLSLLAMLGCSAAPPAEDPELGRLTRTPFGDEAVGAAINILARSGIGTFDSPDATEPLVEVSEPVSPLALLRDQVRAMALEANAGGGIPGEEIDALIDVEEDLAPPSYVLAGYVVEAETDGAEFARALMGEQAWSQAPEVVFPQLVLVLFTADVVRQRQAAGDEAEARASVAWAASPRCWVRR